MFGWKRREISKALDRLPRNVYSKMQKRDISLRKILINVIERIKLMKMERGRHSIFNEEDIIPKLTTDKKDES